MASDRAEIGSTLTHLQCSACSRQHDADRLQTLCPACGKVLLARYDLQHAARTLSREAVAGRPRGMWRWREPTRVASRARGSARPVLDRRLRAGEGTAPPA